MSTQGVAAATGAAGSLARRDRTTASILARVALLKSVISAPAEADAVLKATLRQALGSQAGLARLELPPPHNVTAMSLNTLKARAAEVVESGFRALDQLRRRALEALRGDETRRQRARRRTAADLLERLKAQDELVHRLYDEIAHMSARELEYVALLREYAEKAGELAAFGKRQRELRDKYSHTWAPPKGE